MVLAKLFYSNRRLRRGRGKSQPSRPPPTPPPGRLMQFGGMPHHKEDGVDGNNGSVCGIGNGAIGGIGGIGGVGDGGSSGLGGCSALDEDEDDECRVALTSAAAAALNHHHRHLHGGSVSPYGHCGGSATGSMVSPSTLPLPLPMAHYCHCHHFSGCPSAAASQVRKPTSWSYITNQQKVLMASSCLYHVLFLYSIEFLTSSTYI